jgi:hypothetical protein
VTPTVLVEGLRWLFWGLVYLATLFGALMVFARVGTLKWVALLAVAYVIADDVRRKRGKVAA